MLLSFLGSSRTVFADSDLPVDSITVSYSHEATSNIISSFYSATPAVYQGEDYSGYTQWGTRDYVSYRDVTIIIDEAFYFNPSTNASNSANVSYTGFLQSYGTIDIFVQAIGNNTGLYSYELLSVDHSNISDYQKSTTYYVYADYTTNIKRLRMNRNELFYVSNYNYTTSTSGAPIYNRSTYKFRIYGTSLNLANGGPNFSISINVTATPTGRGSMYAVHSDSYYLYNELETQKQILNSISTSGGNTVAAINAASAQAHSDAQVAESQAAQLSNDIRYDNSGTSQSVSATQSAYDAAQGAADAAVDSAVHNYTSDLSTVEAYDYSSFFTSQRNSAVFWRDVGEYILDSNNLGFVSGSIIIVTLIGLVIFMLRL